MIDYKEAYEAAIETIEELSNELEDLKALVKALQFELEGGQYDDHVD